MNSRKRDSTGQIKSPKVYRTREVLIVEYYLKQLLHLSIYFRMINSHLFINESKHFVKNFGLKSYPYKYNFMSP